MGALLFYPRNNADGTITLASGNQATTDLYAGRIVHDNVSFEEGYATLAVKVEGVTGDTFKFYLGLYYGGDLDNEFDFLLENESGIMSFGENAEVIFSLNRQSFWTLHEGFVPKVKKTGTNGAATIWWRLLYR